jgi:hypothetical protein
MYRLSISLSVVIPKLCVLLVASWFVIVTPSFFRPPIVTTSLDTLNG